MTKQEILNHEGWKFISSLSNPDRYSALFGRMGKQIEKVYGVTIEKYNYTMLSEVPEDCVSISVTDSFKNVSFIAVLKPNVP